MSMIDRPILPTVRSLIYPTIEAVAELGGSAQATEITEHVIETIAATEQQIEVSYPNRSKSILLDRIDWARSWAKILGTLDSPRSGLFLITTLGKETLALSREAAEQRIGALIGEYRSEQRLKKLANATSDDDASRDDGQAPSGGLALDDLIGDATTQEIDSAWETILLRRLHELTPDGFEEFCLYLLRTFGLQLTRVGRTGDEGIDGIGFAPISPVLSSRVAVQAKRYEPSSTVGREAVALFQRDASAVGAERAVFITLGRFSEPARKAATIATPTVDLIDGARLCELVRQQEIGIRFVPVVEEHWFDRFL
jgi:restriction system protein